MTMSTILRHIFLLVSLTSSTIASSQIPIQSRELDSSLLSKSLNELRNHHGIHKNIPDEYESAILTALSFIPELESTEIIFKMSKINTSLNARPKFGSGLFRRKGKRKYVVRIHPPTEDSTVTLDQASFNAQVGVFGHELNHLVDYSQRSFFGIMERGLAYFSSKSKQKYEKEIDRMTIACGLGWQLHDWSRFVVEESIGTIKYKKFKREIYLEPVEIVALIKSMEDAK